MIRGTHIRIALWFILALSLLLQSCGGGGSGTAGGTTGTLVLGLTDAPGDYQNVFVTIKEVQVNQAAEEEGDESGWLTVLTPGQTFDLLGLQNGVIAELGLAEVEAGQYNQMRLILGNQPDNRETHTFANYVIIEGEEGEGPAEEELKVPSGYQTGIKIVHGFTIVASGATELILDFEANKSVVQAGNSGKWLLKPTIKVLETRDMENWVSGVVNVGPDAFVSAQIYDSESADPKNEVIVETTTESMEDGAYKLFLPLNTYNIVATKGGYLPACQEVEAEWYFDNETADFSLVPEAGIITISGIVSGLVVTPEEPDPSASLRIMQKNVDCGSGNVTIEVASVNVANGGSYSFTLPIGSSYDLVASSENEPTQVIENINADTEQNIVFD